jgi:hypothetical protein
LPRHSNGGGGRPGRAICRRGGGLGTGPHGGVRSPPREQVEPARQPRHMVLLGGGEAGRRLWLPRGVRAS